MTPTQQHLLSQFSIRADRIRAPRELPTITNWPKLLPLPEDRDWSVVTSAAITESNRLNRTVPASPVNSVARSAPARTQAPPRVSAVSECHRLNIPFTPHPTNPGLTGMRATNALNAYYRNLPS